MRKWLRAETVTGLILFLFGFIYFIGTRAIKVTDVKTVSDKFMPTLSCLLLMIFSAILVIMDQAKAAKGEKGSKPVNIRKLLLIIVVFAASVAMLKPLGFIISMVFFLMVMFFVSAPAGKRNPFLLVPLAIVIPIIIYFLFLKCFSILLPQGIIKV